LFKTRRSFRYVSADIDFLLLENADLTSASKLLTERRGANLLLIGPNSATFLDLVAEMNIDLYGRISVSYLEYINKDKLKSRSYLQETIDFGGQRVPSLDFVADTLVIAAHSVFKEQMYTLADFYTMTDAIAKMSPEQLHDFVSLVCSQKCNLAVGIFLGLTNILHRAAFLSVDTTQLRRLGEKINLSPVERVVQSYVLAKFVRNGLKTPHKMDLISVIFIVTLKLLWDRLALRSSVSFLRLLVHKDEAFEFISEQLSHMKRVTY
jgi:hypothetical protein